MYLASGVYTQRRLVHPANCDCAIHLFKGNEANESAVQFLKVLLYTSEALNSSIYSKDVQFAKPYAHTFWINGRDTVFRFEQEAKAACFVSNKAGKYILSKPQYMKADSCINVAFKKAAMLKELH